MDKMNDKFDQLREAIQACQDDAGSSSPNKALLQYRNTANLGTIRELVAAHVSILIAAATHSHQSPPLVLTDHRHLFALTAAT